MPIQRPLVISSGGGGGHITAAKSIILSQTALFGNDIEFTKYTGSSTPDNPSISQQLLRLTMRISNSSQFARATASFFARMFQSPAQPPYDQSLEKPSIIAEDLQYVELMDAYPEKKEFIYIYDYLQKNGQIKDIQRAVGWQWIMDWSHHNGTRDYFLNMLKAAHGNKKPYTSVINTQAQGISGLCDAVIEYNKWAKAKSQNHVDIHIDQYMTDILSPGATHYLTPLKALNYNRAQQIKLYYVGEDASLLENLQVEEKIKIETTNNPMVNACFKLVPAAGTLTIKIGENSVEIKEGMMMITLGANGGGDVPREYISNILSVRETLPIKQICVFACHSSEDQANTESSYANLRAQLQYKSIELILIPKQPEDIVAEFMKRADYLIVKPGGLTTFNVMSMIASNTNKNKPSIIIHKPKPEPVGWLEQQANSLYYWLFSTPKEMRDGLTWENCNAQALSAFARNHNLKCQIIQPDEQVNIIAAQSVPNSYTEYLSLLLSTTGYNSSSQLIVDTTAVSKNSNNSYTHDAQPAFAP